MQGLQLLEKNHQNLNFQVYDLHLKFNQGYQSGNERNSEPVNTTVHPLMLSRNTGSLQILSNKTLAQT